MKDQTTSEYSRKFIIVHLVFLEEMKLYLKGFSLEIRFLIFFLKSTWSNSEIVVDGIWVLLEKERKTIKFNKMKLVESRGKND